MLKRSRKPRGNPRKALKGKEGEASSTTREIRLPLPCCSLSVPRGSGSRSKNTSKAAGRCCCRRPRCRRLRRRWLPRAGRRSPRPPTPPRSPWWRRWTGCRPWTRCSRTPPRCWPCWPTAGGTARLREEGGGGQVHAPNTLGSPEALHRNHYVTDSQEWWHKIDEHVITLKSASNNYIK